MFWVPCEINTCEAGLSCVRPNYLVEPEICLPDFIDLNNIGSLWTLKVFSTLLYTILILLGLLVFERFGYVSVKHSITNKLGSFSGLFGLFCIFIVHRSVLFVQLVLRRVVFVPVQLVAPLFGVVIFWKVIGIVKFWNNSCIKVLLQIRLLLSLFLLHFEMEHFVRLGAVYLVVLGVQSMYD